MLGIDCRRWLVDGDARSKGTSRGRPLEEPDAPGSPPPVAAAATDRAVREGERLSHGDAAVGHERVNGFDQRFAGWGGQDVDLAIKTRDSDCAAASQVALRCCTSGIDADDGRARHVVAAPGHDQEPAPRGARKTRERLALPRHGPQAGRRRRPIASIRRVSHARSTLDERGTPSGADRPEDTDQPSALPSPEARGAGSASSSRRAGCPHLDIAELWHYRELLWTLVWRDVAVRYKQTFLGIAWAILVPAFTALIYVIIFGKFANFPAGDIAVPEPRASPACCRCSTSPRR